VYIGDSVGAHFHVPATWFTPSELTTGILTNVSYVISNEFDWPDVGFATGFRNATQMPKLIFDDHVDSLYLRLRKRNRCNHRDYQVSHSKYIIISCGHVVRDFESEAKTCCNF
jgi:acyloxyacyl hydrolase